MKKNQTTKSSNEVYISKTLMIPLHKISYIQLSDNGKYTCKTIDGGSFQITDSEYKELINSSFFGKEKQDG